MPLKFVLRYQDHLPLNHVQVAAFSILASLSLTCKNAYPVILVVVYHKVCPKSLSTCLFFTVRDRALDALNL